MLMEGEQLHLVGVRERIGDDITARVEATPPEGGDPLPVLARLEQIGRAVVHQADNAGGFLAFLGQTLVVLALTLVYTPRVARVVRACTLVIRELPYVEAARAVGVSTPRLLRVHILPNLMSPILVQLSFIFAYALLAEAGLSFLGVGVGAEIPTWGSMVAASTQAAAWRRASSRLSRAAASPRVSHCASTPAMRPLPSCSSASAFTRSITSIWAEAETA